MSARATPEQDKEQQTDKMGREGGSLRRAEATSMDKAKAAQIRSAGIAVSPDSAYVLPPGCHQGRCHFYAFSATTPTGWWQYAFCTFASRVAKSGGSRWQPSATMYFFLFVAHPCGGSVATTRVAVVLRRVPRLFLFTCSYFFSFCTARSSLASVPLAGSAASPPPRVLKDIKSGLTR